MRSVLVLAMAGGLATSALGAPPTTADFETATPAGFFVFNGGASSVSTATAEVQDAEPLARPGQVGPNGVLTTQFTIGDFGGFGVDFAATGSTGPQDWSGTDGFAFWFYGGEQRPRLPGRDPRQPLEPERGYRGALRLRLRRRLHGLALHPHSLFGFRARHRLPARGRARRRADPDRDVGLGHRPARPAAVPRPIAIDDVGPIEHVIDDFESGLPSGTDANGVAIGFFTFQGASSTVAISTGARRRAHPAGGGRAEHRAPARLRRRPPSRA